MINLFLDEMSKEAKNIITTVCDEQCTLSDRLLPKHCAPMIAQVLKVSVVKDFKFNLKHRRTVGGQQEEKRENSQKDRV